MDEISRILKYWRNSLADANRMAIRESELQKAYNIKSSLEEAELPQEYVKKLFKEKKELIERHLKWSGKDEEVELSRIDVLISPIKIIKLVEHGKRQFNGKNEKFIHLMWVPAQLDRNGKLYPGDTLPPWIVRDVLEPVPEYAGRKQNVTIGTVKGVDEYMTLHDPPQEKWDKYTRYCYDFFKSVTEKDLSTFELEGFHPEFTLTVLLDSSSNDISDGIIQLYDQIIGNKELPQVARNFASPSPPVFKAVESPDTYMQSSSRHLGQMGYEFPLSESQRQALYHFQNISDGEMIAVNGPPGTGKTTLLQSVVANAVVESAVKGKSPYVIVVSSTNNQAVDNIIESFGNAKTKPGPLAQRWLKNIKSYALSLPASNKEYSDENIHFARYDGEGLPKQIETLPYCEDAKREYLIRCNEYAGQHFLKLKKALDFLHQELKDTVEEIKKCPRLWRELCETRSELASYSLHGGIAKYASQLQREKDNRQETLDKLQLLKEHWLKEIRSESFFSKLLILLGVKSAKAKREARYRMIFSDCPVPAEDLNYHSPEALERFIVEQISRTKKELVDYEKELFIVDQKISRNKIAETKWQNWKSENNITSDPPEIMGELDTGLRHDAFLLATHYWEGRWLMEMEDFLADEKNTKKNKRNMQAQWRRYAMLTPCFVSTFYMLPKYFRYYAQNKEQDGPDFISLPLLGYIDLLMVDEAGQVPAEIGGASFALAKKAIVVGDVKQIEPVRRMIDSVDIGNMHKHGLIGNWQDKTNIDRLRNAGVSAFNGSVMKIAQCKSPYRLDGHDEGGMFLAEHRRCYDEIIAYCNRLAYKDKLIPMRGSPKADERLFPPLGYANVTSQSERYYRSKKNKTEAQAIARWLKENKEKIESRYGPIDSAVGIITPFNAQKWELIDALRKAKIGKKDMTIGTIHSLQGAERPIVIFSPVYGYDDPRTLRFINRNVNMLNVAVSRARDSFLVFGNMCIFNPAEATPSGILANFLFADETNELPGIHPKKRQKDVSRIDELKKFKSILKYCIENARNFIMIVSPCISANAIRKDRLEPLLKDAVSRNVKIKVYTDMFLDMKYSQLKSYAEEGREILKQCGVELIVAQGIHNKTLCVDDRYLVEGSFNWLSASRDPKSDFFRHEVSLGYKGENVAAYIAEAVKQMEAIAKQGSMKKSK